jgi:short chain dehydrogenase
VRAFGVVELQRAGEPFEHAFGDAADIAAFQAGVVGNADSGQDRDLFAAQSRNAPRTVGGEPGLVWRDLGSPGGQELADLGLGVHADSVNPARPPLGDPASTPINRDSHPAPDRASLEPMTTSKQTWFITGAGRGMGIDFAKAALAAGHNVVATGRNPDTVAAALGDSEDLLVVKLDVTTLQAAEAAVAAAVDRSARSTCS